ncbi:hypothetical protein PLICRDRAFT_339978 [Plicaturopsis crispa FD-325 SS-3]|uniref:Uncharacterized protein n=1 Tax=Plicaturopsis crispa FD-325 SS-3 TaxID=944288 RepID=A0A0C9SY13_PLICR|nr:hypothetical protein PLICRDRAFT_339978 [Plicaturopsis crispa FD-325 SS-3]
MMTPLFWRPGTKSVAALATFLCPYYTNRVCVGAPLYLRRPTVTIVSPIRESPSSTVLFNHVTNSIANALRARLQSNTTSWISATLRFAAGAPLLAVTWTQFLFLCAGRVAHAEISTSPPPSYVLLVLAAGRRYYVVYYLCRH